LSRDRVEEIDNGLTPRPRCACNLLAAGSLPEDGQYGAPFAWIKAEDRPDNVMVNEFEADHIESRRVFSHA